MLHAQTHTYHFVISMKWEGLHCITYILKVQVTCDYAVAEQKRISTL